MWKKCGLWLPRLTPAGRPVSLSIRPNGKPDRSAAPGVTPFAAVVFDK